MAPGESVCLSTVRRRPRRTDFPPRTPGSQWHRSIISATSPPSRQPLGYAQIMDFHRDFACSMRATFIVVCALLQSGCSIHTTPDGHSLWSGSRTSHVRKVLGEPDMIEEHEQSMWGPYLSTTFTYLQRGYAVKFTNRFVRRVVPIEPSERAYVEQRVRAYRDVVKTIHAGEKASVVIRRLGPPDYVVSGSLDDDAIERTTFGGAYFGQLETPPIPEWTGAYWKQQYVYVEFRGDRVQLANPMTTSQAGFLNDVLDHNK